MPKKVKLEDINKKLELILAGQRKIFKEEKKVEKEEKILEKEEKEELEKLEELKKLEKEALREAGPHPLKKITLKDISKGCVGAVIGVVAHYTFVYGIKVAAEIDVTRATLLFPISYALGGIFMYLTGFRRIKDPKLLSFLPVRLTVLYITAVITATLVLILFNPEFFHSFWDTYKQVATVTLSATIGACTADLLGKE
ncbi:DUF2391 family protein [Candidatus Woesearchaeota archaeon]|nr:DUF2391 family protein [Candidatus Woesearchaeota archaeon]